jgi:hypothetical protein
MPAPWGRYRFIVPPTPEIISSFSAKALARLYLSA